MSGFFVSVFMRWTFFLSLQFYLGPQSLNFMIGTINHKIFSLYLNSLINVLNYHKGNNWDADFVCLFWGRVYFTAVIQDVGTGARRQYLMCRSWRSPVKTFLPLSWWTLWLFKFWGVTSRPPWTFFLCTHICAYMLAVLPEMRFLGHRKQIFQF